MGIENPVHLLFIAVVVLLVLGPKRLPALARALGEGIREFRASLEAGAEGEPEAEVSPVPAPELGTGAERVASEAPAPGRAAPPGPAA